MKRRTTSYKKGRTIQNKCREEDPGKFPGLRDCVSSARLASLKEGQMNRKPKT